MVHPADDLASFIDASPTQFHATHNAAARLLDAGFEVFESARAHEPGNRFVVRDGAIIAWVDGAADSEVGPLSPLRMIGAHTDSPNLRVRPRPDTGLAGFRQLGVEVYGGALLNSWLDRDLGLAGRVAVRSADTGEISHRLFRTESPLLRVPQLAIHLDREISERGLLLNKQQHMTPVWGLGDPNEGEFRAWLAEQVDVAVGDVVAWDVACFDHQPSARLGVDGELLAAARLDNLCLSFGAVEALIATKWSGGGPALIALYAHEEVGSTTATGADSTWLARVLEQRALALGADRTAWLASLENSMLLSADMAHGTHPNYPERHEPRHWVRLGGGPVIKHNVNARYATDSTGAAAFRAACEQAGVPVQDYSHRGDLPCGSTIGPLASAQLAIRTVDVGMAQLSMHSIRELMAVADVETMVDAFTAWLSPV
ncbi:M18 family aminopeptidase [soil metagenome]